MGAPSPTPGWYPDPSGAPGQRYWDGQQWTIPARPPSARKVLAIIAVPLLFFGGLATGVAIGMHWDEFSTSRGSSHGDLNQPVRDGTFEFVVSDVKTATSWYAAGCDTPSMPRGQWVIATMTVRNIGKEPEFFDMQDQELFDAAGRKYAADTRAARSMNNEAKPHLDPGFITTVRVPFDVPPGTALDRVELHQPVFSGGLLSGGATVKVS